VVDVGEPAFAELTVEGLTVDEAPVETGAGDEPEEGPSCSPSFADAGVGAFGVVMRVPSRETRRGCPWA